MVCMNQQLDGFHLIVKVDINTHMYLEHFHCGKVVSGVPQGSVLATTLIVLYMLLIFLVYPHALSECIADMFADDSTISAHNKNIDKVDSTLSNELQRVDK